MHLVVPSSSTIDSRHLLPPGVGSLPQLQWNSASRIHYSHRMCTKDKTLLRQRRS